MVMLREMTACVAAPESALGVSILHTGLMEYGITERASLVFEHICRWKPAPTALQDRLMHYSGLTLRRWIALEDILHRNPEENDYGKHNKGNAQSSAGSKNNRPDGREQFSSPGEAS